MQTCDTVVKCPTPPLTLCRRVMPKYNQVATLYTVWTTPSVTLAKNSSAYTHGEVVRGRSFKHFKNFCSTRKVLDVLPSAVSQVRIQTLDGSSRTGTFSPTPITTGYTGCSVNGVYLIIRVKIKKKHYVGEITILRIGDT